MPFITCNSYGNIWMSTNYGYDANSIAKLKKKFKPRNIHFSPPSQNF